MADVSLLIPCYNAAKFLPRLAESVDASTRGFSRVLCYDDGSTDDTVATARQLGFEIIPGGRNRGVAHARNRLGAAARSTWLHFHDADDLIAPRFLERLTEHCTEHNDVVSCDADWLDETGAQTLIAWRYDPEAMQRESYAYLLSHPISLNNSIIRRSAWEKIGGCDESLTMWEDADVHIRLARDGARFHHVPEVLTQALRRQESFSHDYRRSWLCRCRALEGYASDPRAHTVRSVLACEAEKAAAVLALHREKKGAVRAIALARKLGVRPPTTSNPLLRMLKLIMPAYPLLRWQVRRRNRTAL